MNSAEGFDRRLARLCESFSSLPDKPEETAEGTLRALWRAAAGLPCSVELATEEDLPELDAAAYRRLDELIEKRLSDMPLAHLTARQRFMNLEMLAGPDALIPRKETEILAAAALQTLAKLLEERETAIVVDICTGGGNLALAFAHYQQRCQVYAADLSTDAVDFARRNALHLGLSDRVEFRTGDLLEPFAADLAGKVDLLTCNPPYISAAKVGEMPGEISEHEPRLAFDGGPFGISILTRLVKQAPDFLRPASWLCFEVGLGQGPPMAKRLGSSKHFDEVRTFEDANGEVRALAARNV